MAPEHGVEIRRIHSFSRIPHCCRCIPEHQLPSAIRQSAHCRCVIGAPRLPLVSPARRRPARRDRGDCGRQVGRNPCKRKHENGDRIIEVWLRTCERRGFAVQRLGNVARGIFLMDEYFSARFCESVCLYVACSSAHALMQHLRQENLHVWTVWVVMSPR